MSIKLITTEQGRRRTLKIIRQILKDYDNIDFNIESVRNEYTNEELEKIITLKLRRK